MPYLLRVLLALTLTLNVVAAVHAATRAFAPRFSLNARGDIVFVANSSMTCPNPGTDSNCAAAQSGTYNAAGGSTNNSYSMTMVDIDGDASTTNSSSATLNVPAGATIAFAGLYWAGQTTSSGSYAARSTVKFKPPGGAYQTLTATQLDDVGTAPTSSYQAFRDITALVAALPNSGSGVYTVGNIASNSGSNQYAGWTLVVVYTSDTIATTRNLVVYDGYQRVASGTPPINIGLSGFITPPFGPVNSKLGVVAYDGDRGSTEGSAGLLFGPDTSSLTPVSNALNPQTDVFNSTISTLGVINSGRNPAFQNTLGFDADIFAPNTPLPNNATTAALRVQSSSETIDVGVITMATDIFVPNIKDTLTKTVAKVGGAPGAAIVPGDTLEYTSRFYNAGQDGALNVIFADTIPTNTSYVAGSMSVTNTPQSGAAVTITPTDATGDDVGEYDSVARRITIRAGSGATATQGGSLIPANASGLPSVMLKFRVTVNAAVAGGTSIDNFATVTSRQQTLGGTIADVSDSDSATPGDQPARVVIAGPDLIITKVANGSLVPGRQASYTVTVSNSGPLAQAASFGAVTVSDTLPPGLTLIAMSGTLWSCSGTTCTRSDPLAVGASYEPITVVVQVASDAPASVTNVASVTNTAEATTAQGNNTASDTSPVVSSPVLVSTKTAGASFVRGSTSSYTLNVGVSAGAAGTDGSPVTVSDTLPPGITLSGTPSGAGWTCGGVAGDTAFTCVSSAVVAAGGSFNAITVPVRIALSAPAEVSNTFSVSGGGAPTPVSATATTTIATSADLRISKAVNTNLPAVNSLVDFTITVSNDGPSAATNVVAIDALPAGLTFVSASAQQGSYASATGQWAVGTLNPGASVTLTLRATVATATPLTNTATVSATENDPAPANNSASVSLQGQQADLSLQKAVSTATPNVGSNVTYTLTLNNAAGGATASNIVVTDLLPASLAFVSATPAAQYDANTGRWVVASLAPGASTSLAITARVLQPGPIINHAEVTAVDQFDPDSTPNNGRTNEDDYAQVTITGQQADLSIAKSVDNSNPLPGDTITYTVTISNAGPSDASGVIVNEDLPAGLTLISATASQGSVALPVWSVGTIANGGRAVLTVVARYSGPGQVTNTASITASDQPDPTPNAPARVTVPSQIADLALSKTVSNLAPNVGSNVTYTITVSNAGPDAATGVIVSEVIPTGLALISTAPSQGSYDAVNGEWQVGTIANGAQATLQVLVRVTGLAPISNTAEVKSARQFDPNSTPNNRVPTENDQASVTITPQSTDLRLAKSVSPSNPTAGSPQVTYTIVVSNNGPSTATNVLVGETLPAGITLVTGSATTTTGTFNAGTGQWTIPSLANGATATLRFVATVSTFGVALVNAANIISSDQPDPSPEPAATATVLGQVADLGLTKTASAASPAVGSNVTFTLTLNNAGPNAATGVKVRDLLPPGLTFVSATPSIGAYDSATGVWDVSVLAASASATLSLVARVSQATAAPITNTAEVSASDQFDPNSTPNNGVAGENDQASVTITPVPQADLAIVKVAPVELYPGQIATYVLRVTNLGPSTAAAVTVSDPTPAGLTLTSVNGAGCTVLPCNLGSIPLGETRVVTVVYQVNFPATTTAIANTATVSSSTADPNPNNNTQTVSTPIVRDANLSVVKTGTGVVVPGEFADYTLVISNGGPATAAQVQISDATPLGMTFVGASAPCGGGINGCLLGDMAVGQSVTISVRYLVASAAVAGNSGNTATVSSTGPNASPDPAPGNNTSTALTRIDAPLADVTLQKTGPDTVLKGDRISFDLVVGNLGPSDATSVEVADPTPAGLSLVSVAGACTAIGAIGSNACVISTLPVGAKRTVTVTYQVPLNYAGSVTPAMIENRAQAAATSNDPDGSNNIATARANALMPPPVLGLDKVGVGTFIRGSTASYALTVNALASGGDTTGAPVTVSDTLPSGLTLGGTPSGSGWICVTGGASSFTCTSTAVVTTGAAFPAITVPVRVGVAADAVLVNTASVTGGGAQSPASGTATTTVLSSADVSIAKSVDRLAPTAADPVVTFTLTALNAGPSTASAVTVQDLLPAGLSFVSATPNVGSYNPASGIWTVGDLPVDSRAVLTIRATVTNFSGSITNTATIGSPTPDPSSSNNSASATLRGQQADLSLGKSVSNTRPNVQSEIDFTLVVGNAGPDTATGVVVSDVLPSGLAFVAATPSVAYDAATGLWNVGSVASGATATLTLRARVTDASVLSNTAEIVKSDQFDPNSTPGNAVAGENDQATVTVFPQQSDVRLAKSVNNPTPLRGDTVVYVVEVSNLGPSEATNVLINETLPVGVSFTSFVPSSGAFDAATGNWSLATLPAGSRASLTLSGVFRGPNAQTNTAQILSLDQYDPTPNAPVSVTVPSQIADLLVQKTASTATPVQGGTVTFTVQLTNAGPDRATGVVVNDLLPLGLTLVSASASQGSYDSVSGNWSIGNVDVGSTPTLTLNARVDSFVAISNVARLAASQQYDPNSVPNNDDPTEDDQAQVRITPQSADLRVAKRADTNAPTLANPLVTFTIDVFNAGPNDTAAVTVGDALPAGLTLQSATATLGSYGGGVWTIPGTLPANTRATLTLVARVTDFTRPITNTARIIASALPDPTPNEQASATVQGQVANLSLSKTVSASAPRVGSVVDYTLTLRNAGPNTATNVSVLDRLPAGLALVNVSANAGSYDPATGIWSVGVVPADALSGTPITLTLSARITQTDAAPIINRAEIRSSDQFDPNSTPNNAIAGEDDQAEVIITPVPVADLTVAKLPPAELHPGSRATYTIVVKNLGPSSATNVRLLDPSPPGLTFVSATCGSFPCALGSLLAGEERTISVVYQVPFPFTATDPQTNVATALSDTFDPNPGNNTDTAGASVNAKADVQLSKIGPATATPGATVRFTLTAVNAGPSAAGAVTIDDPVQAGIDRIVSVSGSGCTALPCNVGTLAAGASVSVDVDVRIDPAQAGGSTVRNVANVAAATPDGDLLNNTASADLVMDTPVADLRISKTGPATARPGDRITFAIRVDNVGPSDARRVTISDPLPPDFTLLGVSGACSLVPCTIDRVAANTSAQLYLTGTVNRQRVTGFALVNTASVTAATSDPTPSNVATATINIDAVPDLTVSIAPTTDPLFAGQAAVIALTVSNVGAAATGGVHELRLDFGYPVTLQSTRVSGYTCLGVALTTVICTTTGVLAPGQTVSIPITILPSYTGDIAVVATVSGGGERNLNNNTASTTMHVIAMPVPVDRSTYMLLLALLLFAAVRYRARVLRGVRAAR